MIDHLLTHTVAIWRETSVPDGYGGTIKTFHEHNGAVPARLSQPTAQEQQDYGTFGALFTHTVYFAYGTDVMRADQLHTSRGDILRVIAVMEPSKPAYTKALCEFRQKTDDDGES